MFWTALKACRPYLSAYKREISIGLAAILLTDLANLLIPWLLKGVIDLLPNKPSNAVLIQYSLLIIFAAVMAGASRFGWRKYLFGTSRKIEFDILNALTSHLLRLDRNFYLKKRIGDLMSRATNDLRAIREFIGLALLILLDSTVVIIACVFLMSTINFSLMLYCLAPLPLVSVLFFKFSKTIGERQREVQEHLSKISTMVQENLAGVRVLHAFVREEHEKAKFDALNREYIQKNLSLTRLLALFHPSLTLTLGAAAILALWLGSREVISGTMTLGSFVAFNGYLMMLSWPMMGIGFVFTLTQKGVVALKRLDEIMSSKPSFEGIPESPGEPDLRGEIEFRGLNFSYSGSTKKTLDDVGFKIRQGESAAILGMIGSGKTTLVQLLPRIFDTERGTLLIDGRPIQDISLGKLRDSIGYVGQEPFLFSMTLRENIVLAKEDASEEEVLDMARLAGLESDLERFPNGLDTLVGERGVALSGGQKQRVALARALIKRPKILVLDDAFSSLDVETEELILKNIRGFIRDITTVVVTHRLSAVRDVDHILVLDGGRLVQQGGHAELIRKEGPYRRLFKDQMLARGMDMLIQ